jgi:hypothetical protein
MEPLVHVVTGKQGRTNANKPAHELLALYKNIAMDSEILLDFEIKEIAGKVLALARTHAGHRFDEAYMAAHDGAYGISAITIDTEYGVHAYTVPLFRPTSHGGHVLFRTGKEIENVLRVTRPDIKAEEAGGMELGLFASKFKGLDCLLIVPDTFDHPELFRALQLETKGDGTDTTTLVYLRLCDKLGLGRSPPHLSIGKFKFLFPGVELDTSLVKSKGTKRGRDVAPSSSAKPAGNVWDVLESMLNESVRDLRNSGLDMTSADYRAKSFLFGLAKHFLMSFDGIMGRETFNKVFAGYAQLPANIVLTTMGNKDIINGIIESNVDDMKIRNSLMQSVYSYAHMLSGQ